MMSTLNSRQRRVLVLSGAVALIMMLFPPWQTFHLNEVGRPLPEFFKYAAVFARPTYHATDGSFMAVAVEISWGLVSTQLCALGVCTVAALLLLRRPRAV